MPSDITAEMFEAVQKSTTSFCVCCKVVRTDGTVFGFTNNQRDISVEGIRYVAGSGMTPSALQSQSGVRVDNAEIKWVFLESQVSERDMRAGFFEDASCYFFLINFLSPQQGIIKGPKGNLGQTTIRENGDCSIEFKSLSQRTKNKVGELTCETCRAMRLGDEDCRFDLNGLTFDGYATRHNGWVSEAQTRRVFISNLNNTFDTPATNAAKYVWEEIKWERDVGKKKYPDSYDTFPVASFDGDRFFLLINPNIREEMEKGETGIAKASRISDGAIVYFDLKAISVRKEVNGAYSIQVNSDFWGQRPEQSGDALPSGFFNNGILQWTSGANKSIKIEVMIHDDQSFTLQELMPFNIEVNDSFTVEVGCDRTCTTCRVRFNNVINFVGEPSMKPMEEVQKVDD